MTMRYHMFTLVMFLVACTGFATTYWFWVSSFRQLVENATPMSSVIYAAAVLLTLVMLWNSVGLLVLCAQRVRRKP